MTCYAIIAKLAINLCLIIRAVERGGQGGTGGGSAVKKRPGREGEKKHGQIVKGGWERSWDESRKVNGGWERS